MLVAATSSMILVIGLILFDGWLTRKLILESGRSEGNPVRAFLIRSLGIDGGTIGVSVLVAIGMFWGNSVPQPYWERILVNAFVAVAYIYAISHNLGLKKR